MRVRFWRKKKVAPVFDPDAGEIPSGFWDRADIVEPEGTEQITLRLPRRVLRHFKATGKGWQTRVNEAIREWLKTHSPSQ